MGVMAGLVPAIHVFVTTQNQDVDARDIGVLSTPFFERLCAGMTINSNRSHFRSSSAHKNEQRRDRAR